jgi:hypothetical protein
VTPIVRDRGITNQTLACRPDDGEAELRPQPLPEKFFCLGTRSAGQIVRRL